MKPVNIDFLRSVKMCCFLLLVCSGTSFGQINEKDSTVQVIGYWSKGDKQSYTVSLDKFKVKGADTTSREHTSYDVDITVTDSSADSYTIEWAYKNYNADSENAFVKKLGSLSQNMSVIIKTDEMGAFKEVKNWKELKAEMDRCLGLVKKELKDLPNIDELVRQVSNVYTSKEAIESVAIKDIQQFYTYHGGKYTLGEEVKGQIKLPNLYGGEPFDAEVTLQMDEINFEDENAIIRMWQTADSKQLTAATYEYLSKIAKASGVKSPSQEEIPPLQNQTMVASRLHGPSGWVIYSLETKEVSAENVTNVEERIIEIK